MNSADQKKDSQRNRLHITFIAATTIAAILISLYYLSSGWFIIFQNLFYIPIILSCMYYTMRGFIYSICLVLLYLLLVLFFTSEGGIIMQVLVRVGIFIAVAGVVTFLSIRRKRAELGLRENEETFRRLFEDSTDPILLLDKEYFIDCNPAAVSILGYTSKDEVTKKHPWELSPQLQPDGKPSPEKAAEMMGLAVNNGHHRFEWVHLKSDGTGFPVEVMLTSIVIRGEQLLHVIWRDIAERKQAEEARMESEQKYRSLFENAIEGISQTTPEGRLVSANPALAKLLGYDSPQELMEQVTDIGRQHYVDTKDRETYRNTLETEGMVKGYEVQLLKKDGTPVWASLNTHVVRNEGGAVIYYEGTVEDITTRKLAEEELIASAKKLRKSLVGTIKVVSMMLETRDPYTGGHQGRVSTLARTIAQEMGLPNDAIDIIRMAGTIHDIGKMSVPAEILSKPSRLSDIEMGLLKVHPQTGYDILKVVELPPPIAEIVLQHHERLDGSGYPRGLKDGEILPEALIMSVADVVEAMASHRPYRPALGIDTAMEEIEKNRDTLYNREVVEACVRLFREKGFKFEGN